VGAVDVSVEPAKPKVMTTRLPADRFMSVVEVLLVVSVARFPPPPTVLTRSYCTTLRKTIMKQAM